MNRVRIAVIMTVFNRKNITIRGLQTLCSAIEVLGDNYVFDIYMTDDGSSDGTGNAVSQLFPFVRIVEGDGTLYWGGGMRKAWQTAVDSKINYDFFLWYNDDSDLFENALVTMFDEVPEDCIITGAFCDNYKRPSYGGKIKDGVVMFPNGRLQEVNLMNGNLVLVPYKVYSSIGIINEQMLHGGGDYDYAYRAKEKGFKVFLSKSYVGISERHDNFIPKYCSSDLTFKERWKVLHSPMHSPYKRLQYSLSYCGILKTSISFLISYVGVFSPALYRIIKKKFKNNLQ